MDHKIKSLRETINNITKKHLKKFKTFIFGQNLLGVGQVDNTLPKNLKEKDGIIDLPMADVAGGGIVTNQAGIAKKKFSLNDFNNFQIQFKKFFSKYNIYFDDIAFCPFHENALDLKYRKK